MKKWIFVMVLSWVWFSSTTPMAGETITELEPVVVTATKTPKKLENVPAVVTLISSEEIETMPAKTVGDLLANLPGVFTSEPQGVGVVTPQSITISGNGFPGATLILLDGQKINTPFTDYAYLTTIPVRAVERIEVIRGPFSALYGSSAGGGIINIITKDGGNKSHISPWGQTGDFGRTDYGTDAGIVWDRFSLGLFVDHKKAGNYYLYDDKGIDTRNLDYEHNRFHGKFTGTFGESTNLSLSGGIIDGITGNGVASHLGIDNYQDIEHSYLNLQVSSQVSKQLDLKAQLDWLRSSHNYYGETLERITYPLFGPPIPTFNYKASVNETQADRYRSDISGNYAFDDQHILTLGSEIVYTEASKAIYDTAGNLLAVQGRAGREVSKDDILYSLYSQYDWTFLENFELVLGARFDDYDSYGSELSPKATLSWRYDDNGSIKFSIGRGFKAPNLSQLYSPPWSISPFIVYQGNPNLEAETLWSYQVSLEQRALDKKLFFRLTPYYTDAENFITSVRYTDPLNPGGQIMQPENVDAVDIRGADVELSYDLMKTLTLFANYNYNETRDAKTDLILDGYPRNSASLGFRAHRKLAEDWKLSGSWAARYRGEYTATSWSSPPTTKTAGDYWYHTARIGLDWKDLISLTLDMYNLFNNRSCTDIDRYLTEFNYLAGISFNYRF
jgi:outer membrane receptor for ferrienterochelin and colicin